jgi:hypothetical protein
MQEIVRMEKLPEEEEKGEPSEIAETITSPILLLFSMAVLSLKRQTKRGLICFE